MTERENMLMLLRGEEPEWLPRSLVAPPDPRDPHKPAIVSIEPSLLRRTGTKKGGCERDIFGVEYTATESAGGLALPTPSNFILQDIRQWRDVIKTPDLSGIDWEAVCKKDMAHIDRTESTVTLRTHVGYFQHLMNFMGFTEGLCAMLEEPEEVKALFEYLADFYDEITKNYMYYCKPDMLGISDDTATARNPFVSLEMYRELIKPYHARLGHFAMEAGIPVNMHNCGRCEDQIDDWMEFGVRMWNPAQVMNDLVGIKKKYGNKLILVGCWDSSGPVGRPDAQEEFVRAQVRECIDTFAPGGGFCFAGYAFGPKDDPRVEQRAWWLTDEYNKYGRTWYENHRS